MWSWRGTGREDQRCHLRRAKKWYNGHPSYGPSPSARLVPGRQFRCRSGEVGSREGRPGIQSV